MSVTLLEVSRAAEGHQAALPGELVGYLMLGATEQIHAAPRIAALEAIVLAEDGTVHVAVGQAGAERDAEAALRAAFAGLLEHSSPVTPALTRIAQRSPTGSVAALIREMEAALIPLNRAAGRRALVRLYRDTARAIASGKLRDDSPRREPQTAAARVESSSASSGSAEAADVASGIPVEVLLRSESSALPPIELEESDPNSIEMSDAASASVEPPALHEPSTRPEPVVLRASQRPAPPAAHSVQTPCLGSWLQVAVPQDARFFVPDLVLDDDRDATERMPEISAELEPSPILAEAIPAPEADSAGDAPGGAADEPACMETVAAPRVVAGEPPCAEAPCAEPVAAPGLVAEKPSVEELFVAWESTAPEVEEGGEEASLQAVAWESTAPEVEEGGEEASLQAVAWESTAPEAGEGEEEEASVQKPAWACESEFHDESQPAEAALDIEEATYDLEEPGVLFVDPLTLTMPGLGPMAEGRTETGLAPPPDPAPEWPSAPYQSRFLPRRSDVEALLRGFLAAESKSDIDLCRELTEIAGLERLETPGI